MPRPASDTADANGATSSDAVSLDVERRFLSMVSHELRSPVSAIKGFADLLVERWDTLSETERRDFADRVRSNATRLHELIEDFLDLSRIREEGLVPRLEEFDVAEQVHACTHDLPSVLGEIEIDAPDSLTAVGDVHFCEQIMINLLSNAAKYGAPPYEISAREAGRRRVEVRVRDHGPGVPEEFVPHLFKRFAQADREREGAGLGLSICRDLARAQGGDLRYEPADPGAAFVIVLTVPD